MLQRSITGTVLVVVIVATIYFGAGSFYLLLLFIGLLGFKELSSFNSIELNKTPKLIGYTWIFSVLTDVFLYLEYGWSINFLLIGNSVMFLLLGAYLVLQEDFEKSLSQASKLLASIVYLILPLICFLLFAYGNGGNYQWPLALSIFIFLWVSDTFAYLIGKAIGKTKLIPRVSPKKTVEGLVGGFVFAILAAWIFHHFLAPDDSLVFWFVTAAVVSIAGVFGDLLESVFKRESGLKDSGSILPGHGGILDRFDSLLLAAPAALIVHLLFYTLLG